MKTYYNFETGLHEDIYDHVAGSMSAAEVFLLKQKIQFQRDVERTIWADLMLHDCEPVPRAPSPKRGIRLSGAI